MSWSYRTQRLSRSRWSNGTSGAPRVNPDFKATQVLSDLLEPLALPDPSELPELLALPDLPELSDLLALPGLSDLLVLPGLPDLLEPLVLPDLPVL